MLPSFAARLEVDVAGALVEGVLQQPVDDADDVLVVGVELAGAAQLHQLLEVLHARQRAAPCDSLAPLTELGQRVELDQVAAGCRAGWRSRA